MITSIFFASSSSSFPPTPFAMSSLNATVEKRKLLPYSWKMGGEAFYLTNCTPFPGNILQYFPYSLFFSSFLPIGYRSLCSPFSLLSDSLFRKKKLPLFFSSTPLVPKVRKKKNCAPTFMGVPVVVVVVVVGCSSGDGVDGPPCSCLLL